MNEFIITALLTSVGAGILLTATFLFITAKRTKATAAELHHEMQNLRYELNIKTQQIEQRLYEQLAGTETIVYDSRSGIREDDFTGSGARAWDYVGHRFLEGRGEGLHQVEKSGIIIKRTNTAGRYELHLKKYYDGRLDKIPADQSIVVRHLKLSCGVKRGAASHTLRFVFKGDSQNVLDEKDYVVFNPEWEKLTLVFTISSQEACFLRIDDLHLRAAPDAVEIKDLVLYEKRRQP